MKKILERLSAMQSSPNTCVLQAPSFYKGNPIENYYMVRQGEYGPLRDDLEKIVSELNKDGLECYCEMLYCAGPVIGIVVDKQSAEIFFK